MTAEVSKVITHAVVGFDDDLIHASKLNAYAVVGFDDDLIHASKVVVYAVVGPSIRFPVLNITN